MASPTDGVTRCFALTSLTFLALAAVGCGSESGASSSIDEPTTADATTGSNTTGPGATGATAPSSTATDSGATTGATTGNTESTGTGAGGTGPTGTSGTTGADTTGAGGIESTSNVTTTTSGGGAGGSGGTGDSPIDQLPETNCTVNVMTSEVADVATVGVVTFSADLPGITRAEIQFGKETSYGLIAPVNLEAADYRTLLLGMTQDSTYNYRIAVSDGSQVCYSDNQTLQTGALDVDDLADVSTGEGAPGGFIVTSRGSDVIIFNEAGELVWGHSFGGGIFSAQMSWDGQYMFARDTGPFDAGSGGTFRRVGMDGSGEETLDAPGGDHHDFAAIPGGIAYIGKTAAGECDQVFTASDELTDGEPSFDTWQIFEYFTESGGGGGPQGELCHANRIHYFADADIFTVSDRNKNAIAVFERDGTPVTSIGTTPSGGWTQHIQAEGAGSEWQAQHGHHFYADDKLLVFTNEGDGGSAMLHYTINGGSATLDWSYSSAGMSRTQGDVQYLPNGTFLVTASNSGVIHLLDASQNLISSYSATVGGGGGIGGGGMGGFGYAWFRPTLYGPPPGE